MSCNCPTILWPAQSGGKTIRQQCPMKNNTCWPCTSAIQDSRHKKAREKKWSPKTCMFSAKARNLLEFPTWIREPRDSCSTQGAVSLSCWASIFGPRLHGIPTTQPETKKIGAERWRLAETAFRMTTPGCITRSNVHRSGLFQGTAWLGRPTLLHLEVRSILFGFSDQSLDAVA